MRSITIQELQSDFDTIISRVENGESFSISSEHGSVALVPYGSDEEADDLVRIHTEHEEGC